MSWMDSWSRPKKHQPTPPPFYFLPDAQKYKFCKTCGRAISHRKEAQTDIAYCSSKCRAHKPREVDREIEGVFIELLNGRDPTGDEQTDAPMNGGEEREATKRKKGNKGKKESAGGKGGRKKGETRILVECEEVEKIMFEREEDPDKTFGRKKNRFSRVLKEPEVEEEAPRSRIFDSPPLYSEDEDEAAAPTILKEGDDAAQLASLSVRSGTRQRLPQYMSEVNGGIGGEKGVKERIVEDEDMLEKRREGQKRAEQRERVRCAARRLVAFGYAGQDEKGDGERRVFCEAVMKGDVVEASFAKGVWGIRWREE